MTTTTNTYKIDATAGGKCRITFEDGRIVDTHIQDLRHAAKANRAQGDAALAESYTEMSQRAAKAVWYAKEASFLPVDFDEIDANGHRLYDETERQVTYLARLPGFIAWGATEKAAAAKVRRKARGLLNEERVVVAKIAHLKTAEPVMSEDGLCVAMQSAREH